MTPINLMLSRRRAMLGGAAALATGAALLTQSDSKAQSTGPAAASQPSAGYTPVTTPNGSTLPYKLIEGAKVFHLIAQPVENTFAPGLNCECWGYNGSTPGPTIEAVQGDRVRIYVTNRLPASTTVHWHGLRIPNGMDGVNGLTQKPIPPGQTFKYEFTLHQPGTYMYHPHLDEMTQQGLGMMGMFIIHPSDAAEQRAARVDRDFCLMLSEWRIDPGASRPNPIEMVDFNIFTINSKAFPATAPLVVKKG
jgi:FtsP/CotA-like multicopper oxidase with cupredoxin domain